MDFEIIYYKDSSGNDPIHQFLIALGKSNRILVAKTRQGIDKLRNKAYHKEPLSKYLRPGLWELRVKSGTDIVRVIYTFEKGQIIILLHGFIKKDQKTPIFELEIAQKRLKELQERKKNKNE